MGDGWAESNPNEDKARVRIESATREYLEWIEEELPVFLVSGMSQVSNAGDSRQYNGRTISHNRDTHQLDTIYHPELRQYYDWYNSGDKVWPSDVELTPMVLKNLYCGDGHWNNAGSNNHIQIAMANERENLDKVADMFSRAGLSVSNFNIQQTNSGAVCDAQLTTEESKQAWEYMGEPLPGFEYKWPN